MGQYVARIIAGLAITILLIAHAARLYPTADGSIEAVSEFDNLIYDSRLRMGMKRGLDERIVILDIDEKSLGELGRWPWSRNQMAELVDKLFDRYGVALVAFDVVWAEPDTSSGMAALDSLAKGELKEASAFQAAYEKLRPRLDYDARFAASLKGRPIVLGYYFNGEERAVRVNAIPPPVLRKGTFAGRQVEFPQWTGYTGNLPIYLSNAAGAGHINPMVDRDGVLRRVPLIVEFDGQYYESLSLAIVRTLLARLSGEAPRLEPELPKAHNELEQLRVGPLSVPVDRNAAALVPYRGGKYSFPYVSLSDVAKDRVPPERLKGKVAIVGASALTLADIRPTPVDEAFPGVEIHANLVAGMLDGSLKHKPRFIVGFEVVVLLVVGTVLAILVPRLSALWASVIAAAAVVALSAFNLMVWNHAGWVLPLAASILMIIAIYTMNMAYGYFVESRSKRQLAGRFREYVPPEIVAKMERDPAKYDATRSAELTILFCDVRGFTGISETLAAEDLGEYINQYLSEMSTVIRVDYRGTLDKYIGDAIMAFWNAPLDDDGHGSNAVMAALAMQRQAALLSARFVARRWPPLKIGIGINTGIVKVGNMGSMYRRAYTAVGDPVNVAARLEGRTKGYGVGILVAEPTRRLVRDIVFREIDRVRVKGKDEAVTIYEPIGLESEVGGEKREAIALWHGALRSYRARDWDRATADLARLARAEPDCRLYSLAAANVEKARRAALPADWDGVTVFDEK